MRRAGVLAACGAILGAVVVVTSLVAGNPGWGFFSHTECRAEQSLGNVTVWVPSAIAAAPYLGSESGSVAIWGSAPIGKLVISQPTSVANGSVEAYYVGFVNWTIYSTQNFSVAGPGPETPCAASMIGHFSPNPAQGLRSGGVTSWSVASDQVSDTELPTELNASALCAEVENSSDSACAVGAQFDLDFHEATGTVNTCSQDQAQIVSVFSQEWPVTAPFDRNGHSYSVPLDPSAENTASYSNGTYAWYNYTFPANGGIWQYDNLAETSSTGAGLVFSYSPCP